MLTCLHHDTAVSGQSLHRTSDRIIAYISSDNIVLYLLETKLFFFSVIHRHVKPPVIMLIMRSMLFIMSVFHE